ncbi:MAG: hypothetical protein DYG89_21040 [Caldilinea sp. CFX5]|nr:hypothetical protein [Caldilinea sp. CFX5]
MHPPKSVKQHQLDKNPSSDQARLRYLSEAKAGAVACKFVLADSRVHLPVVEICRPGAVARNVAIVESFQQPMTWRSGHA